MPVTQTHFTLLSSFFVHFHFLGFQTFGEEKTSWMSNFRRFFCHVFQFLWQVGHIVLLWNLFLYVVCANNNWRQLLFASANSSSSCHPTSRLYYPWNKTAPGIFFNMDDMVSTAYSYWYSGEWSNDCFIFICVYFRDIIQLKDYTPQKFISYRWEA